MDSFNHKLTIFNDLCGKADIPDECEGYCSCPFRVVARFQEVVGGQKFQEFLYFENTTSACRVFSFSIMSTHHC